MAEIMDLVEIRRLPRDLSELRQQMRILDDRFGLMEQRLGGLERRWAESAVAQDRLREDLARLEKTVEIGFGDLNGRLDRHEARFEALEARFAVMETRFASMETRFAVMETRFASMETRFDALDARVAGVETQLGSLEEAVRELTVFLRGALAPKGG